MKDGPDIARLAALIGDPARANILTALMSGKALTASELATEAGVSPQTVSSHLRKLEEGGLTTVLKQGRHRYVSLSGDDVAQALEGLMGLAAGRGHLRVRTGPKDPELRHARVCYNHLAGERGVQMFRAMRACGHLALDGDAVTLTDTGTRFVTDLGIDLAELEKSRAPMCRECLDWSARQYHLAGTLGRAMLTRMEHLGWMSRASEGRVITLTTQGAARFDTLFMPDRASQSV
ncbi:ArsR/SmtB family transcription factor [Phaeobacter marinintestinus]|uniref:ArsR/SmtB family transcription factor n=1 Tax=Falsiphaeobacter marinintestinus TaxID=1492905 RepID=UPI0011B74151|nr:winged helix-turn-helix domain-containing protein [Phaeobacter marinintestinus]